MPILSRSTRSPFVDGTLDLGEAAAEQLALALDPYPRAPDAVLPDMPEDAEAQPSPRWRRCSAGTTEAAV